MALHAAGRVLAVAGELRARRDLERIEASRSPSSPPPEPPGGVRSVAWLESRLAVGGALLPDGLPAEWLGQSVEVYGVPTGPASSVSFAIRWHGERPAVLWERTGEPIELAAPVVAPDWCSSEAKGEALWPPPETAASPASPSAAGPPPVADPELDPGSFS